MKTLFAIMMLVSFSAMADGHTLYDHYGYGSRYSNPRVVYPDNVQLHIMQQQAEKTRRIYEDNAVRQGLKDAWNGGGGGCVSCGESGGVYYGR